VALVRRRRRLGFGLRLLLLRFFLLRFFLLRFFLLRVGRGRRRRSRRRGLVLRKRRPAERESDQREYSEEFLHWGSPLERSGIDLAGADANHFFEFVDEDLAVADLAGVRRLLDRFDCLVEQLGLDRGL